jgi:hypothetical protein
MRPAKRGASGEAEQLGLRLAQIVNLNHPYMQAGDIARIVGHCPLP